MVVEFLYNKYKNILLEWLLHAFILQSILFHCIVVCFEAYIRTVLDNKSEADEDGLFWISANEKSRPYGIMAWIFLVLNTIIASILAYSQYILFKNMKANYFKSFYNLVDIVYLSMGVAITIICIYQLVDDQSLIPFESFKSTVKAQRNLEAICIFLIYVKAGYFLSLIDATAPLIDNISQVILDIRYFILVLLIQMFAFSSCFYIIGQN